MREALELFREVSGGESPDVAVALSNLGPGVENQGRLDEADLLVRLYEAWGKPDEAARYRGAQR